jgi:hypothetical protein
MCAADFADRAIRQDAGLATCASLAAKGRPTLRGFRGDQRVTRFASVSTKRSTVPTRSPTNTMTFAPIGVRL